jgi:hypothetical protein
LGSPIGLGPLKIGFGSAKPGRANDSEAYPAFAPLWGGGPPPASGQVPVGRAQ